MKADREAATESPTTPIVVMAVAVGTAHLSVQRVAAAAGCRVVLSSEVVGRQLWDSASFVVVDAAAALALAVQGMPRRAGVVLVTEAQDLLAADWQAAVAIGAEQAFAIPRDEALMVRVLSERSLHQGAKGGVIAVIGGSGGAGASTFSAALAFAAEQAFLIDCDPYGGGIDLLLGIESEPGLRWPDLHLEGGRVSGEALHRALPVKKKVTTLSYGRGKEYVHAEALTAVLEASRSLGGTVICDLPRNLGESIQPVLDCADLVVVVAVAQVRACASSESIVQQVLLQNPRVGLVVRGPSPGGLRAKDLSDVVRAELLATMRPQPRLTQMLEDGGLTLRSRSPLARAARQVLAVVEPGGHSRGWVA
ncbi:MAG: septum site-determining protein Ssd [Mycobacteriaceae bacterium]